MKTEQPILISSIKATADIAKNLCVNKNGGLGEGTEPFFGVCNADTSAGEEAPVMLSGIALCVTDMAIPKGSMVAASDDGLVTLKSDTALGADYIGTALDEATEALQTIRVLIR
jgi:predicted RecA/RadA family phage recombinase